MAPQMRLAPDDEKEHLVIFVCEECRYARFLGFPRGHRGAVAIPSYNFCRNCAREQSGVRQYLREVYKKELKNWN